MRFQATPTEHTTFARRNPNLLLGAWRKHVTFMAARFGKYRLHTQYSVILQPTL